MVRPVFFVLPHFVRLAAIFLLVFPGVVYGADLGFSPGTGTFPADQEFSVQVTVDPAGESVNASDGKISFDPDVLSVASISKDGSSFSLWTSDPTFSNSAGTINYSGGTPSAFKSQGTIITIKFKGKKAGTGKVSIASGTVLAADGKGTDVYKTGGTATFTIGESAPVAEPESEAGSDGVTPIAPVITSTTHPKSDAWYATTTIDLAWKPSSDVTQIRTLLSDKDDALAASLESQKLATSQRVVAKQDGVWYFYVQYRNDFGWGELAKKQIQIDTMPPNEFEVTLRPAEGASLPKLDFSATDSLSGVDRYEVVFGSTSVATVKEGDIVDGGILVPPQEGGETLVTVKAFDKAGNIRTSVKTLTLPAVAKPSPKDTEPVVPVGPFWTIERILLIVFALIMGALIMMGYNARKKKDEDKAHLLRAVVEVREHNDRVFSAMREEFEQMVNDFDEKPQLSAKERDFLENIKEVLDLSEEVIDTGIENLKKQVREQ
jgi:Cohesin domain